MQANPNIEICISSPEFAWIRISGKAVFVDDKEIKTASFRKSYCKGELSDT